MFPSLGQSGLAAELGLNLPGLMASRSRSGGEEGSQAGRTMSGRGGEEASEGGSRSGSSGLGGNKQHLLLASLLGGNRRGILERLVPISPFAANVPGIYESQGLDPLLGGAFGRPQQMSLTPGLILLSSMFGRNRRGGGEGSEGGGESRLFSSLFGRGGGGGGGGGGERSEGRSGGGSMAGMSPILAYMLQQNLGMGLGGQMQGPAHSSLSPLTGLEPMGFGGKMTGSVPTPLLNTVLGGQKQRGLNLPFSMPLFGVNRVLSQTGEQSRDPLMSLMRTRNSGPSLMSPNVSMLDPDRLVGFGGRRSSRRVD
ncbi:MAG: hypothetical protein AB2693_15990 [Candidatus Thiodiazotropha sp.]